MEEKINETVVNANEISENTAIQAEDLKNGASDSFDDNTPLDKNLKLMSPTRMVIRRFFKSKLSIVGLVMVIGLFLFSYVGPTIYHIIVPGIDGNGWDEDEVDMSKEIIQVPSEYTYVDANGVTHTIKQTLAKEQSPLLLNGPSKMHPLGTNETGCDNLARAMYGGRISLTVSIMSIVVMTAIGIVAGGLAGYFGGVIDNIIMRICDVLTCLPGIPILLILGVGLKKMAETSNIITLDNRIYFLMLVLSCISWTGTARLVRGQILSLREQEYMVAAEAMGYSTFRKIFKHLIPNVMPQLIVQMTLGLGSMIIYESTLTYLGFGVDVTTAAWGSILSIFSNALDTAIANPLIWLPAGLCIIIAVLGFNFVGDGLRDALDPKSRR